MKPLKRYLAASLLLPLFLAGCIREDRSDCPEGLRIYFNYETATYAGEGINPAEVEKIALFVFDAQGLFHSVWTDSNPRLSPDYYMAIPDLPVGNYRFIAWAGYRDCYVISPVDLIPGRTTFDEMRLSVVCLSGRLEGSSEYEPLFGADKMDYVRNQTRLQRIDLLLRPTYNTINITTEGLPASGETYRFTIYDNWDGVYKLDCSFAAGGDMQYTTPCDKNTGGQLSASLRILRLAAASRQPILEIYNVTQERALYRADLIELINRMGYINYETTYVYNVHIKFSTDMTAIVFINGWQVTEWTTMPH